MPSSKHSGKVQISLPHFRRNILRETLIMLPGMICDHRLFAPQIDAFSSSHDVLVPQLSGSATIDGLANKIVSETRAERFNLLGLSMGGIVAMAMLRLAPHRISRLALLDTNHKADQPERFAIRNRQIADAEAGRLQQLMAEEMKPSYLSRKNRNNESILSLLYDMASNLGPQVFVEQTLALRDRADQSDVLEQFRPPTLVLCGAEDPAAGKFQALWCGRQCNRACLVGYRRQGRECAGLQAARRQGA
jgi:pimeloyl-ACP methyl ester carboxylesterase